MPHWLITLIPIVVSEHLCVGGDHHKWPKPLSLRGGGAETLFLVFPLHQELAFVLESILSSSVLPAELQLLATSLVNLFVFAASPQAEILKALLWLGGLCVLFFCQHMLRWEVALARIPSWKFRRSSGGLQSAKRILNTIDHKICAKLSRRTVADDSTSDSDSSPTTLNRKKKKEERRKRSEEMVVDGEEGGGHLKRRQQHNTFPIIAEDQQPVKTTPGGRRKRLMAPDLASFLSMTSAQAQVRKWMYALYVYAAVLLIILGPVRLYVGQRALHGNEPFGWALGYLFGNVSWFRFWVMLTNLEGWIKLPPRSIDDVEVEGKDEELFGWVEHVRQYDMGEANTRLLISCHCLLVLLIGMMTMVKLSSFVEVDTRRKVFHGMMVAMFLPTIYIDPTFCALALSLVLSVFLLLDLFRSSQLPPISRPLTYFLAPYVDGRDYRGPVIVSHIFLLIGCSTPLWLTLADSERRPDGWEAVSRHVSMVSGVICVGMGDAAASLVGRRFGRVKWFWGGGKTLEGSAAFALAVFSGLMVARMWISVGGWQQLRPWWTAAGKALIAGGGASATEAVLTGCNDNVVVPVVLWLLVKGLDV